MKIRAVSEATAHVTLHRLPRPRGDLLRTYRVLIDGSDVGGIRRKEVKTFDIAPGRHQVRLKLDWCSSREITIELEPGAEAKQACRARPADLGWSALRSSDYVHLDVVDAVVVADPASPLATRSSGRLSAPGDGKLMA